jgi:hypothetical protein
MMTGVAGVAMLLMMGLMCVAALTGGIAWTRHRLSLRRRRQGGTPNGPRRGVAEPPVALAPERPARTRR